MLLRLSCFVLLALMIAAPRSLAAQPNIPADRAAALDSVLNRLHADSLFSGVVLIGHNGKAVYQQALGDYRGRPVTVQTPLPLASITKPLTATAILSLAEDGLLDVDAPVGRYLADWPYPDLTLRHLLNQTSGLHFLTTVNAHADTTQPVGNAEVLALVAEHRPGLGFTPGTAYRYDNANYVTLASVAEAAAGRPYAEVMQARVFDPAGMDDASIEPDDEGDVRWLTWLGAGGVVASAEDLLAFDRALRSGTLLSPASIRASQTRPALIDSTVGPYGLGWFVYDDPVPMVGHVGDGWAAKTGLLRELESGDTFIILMPGDAIHRTEILLALRALWHGEPYTLPEKRPVADVPESVLARYVGVYDSQMGRLHITLEDSQLHLEPEGAGGSEPLIPASETVFYFGHQDLTWEFTLDDAGAVEGIMLQDHPETLGKKVE